VSGVLIRAAALAAVYLLVISSIAPGDLLIAGVLGLATSFALRPRRRRPQAGPPAGARALATAASVARTAVEMARGSWRTARFCLGGEAHPGIVEIPREGRSREGVAFWGILTGEAPDEVVVDIDETRDVLLVHLIDARDPDAVRARHRRERERWQGRAVP
jgi:multisubunit Na+/H+ antiporter MnhE subunit